MSPLSIKLAMAGAFAAKAYAHALVQGIAADGQYYDGYVLNDYYTKQNTGSYPDKVGWYEEATDLGYVAPSAYGESDIICHKNAENAALTATVAAGGTVDFYWTTWPDSHIGPLLTYVANCGGDCSTVDKTTLKFVKIAEAGIDLDTQTWATADLIANNMTSSITVPSTLASGNYVFRHEIIAMHGASSVGGAQNYPFCINIAITGGGSDSPEGTLGTALYTETDAGIYFNPYTTLTSYDIPGPDLYTGGSSSGSSSTTSSSSSASATGSASGASSTGSVSVSNNAASGSEDDESECASASARRHRRHARQVKI